MQCPLLAQSGYTELQRTCPLLGVKRRRFARKAKKAPSTGHFRRCSRLVCGGAFALRATRWATPCTALVNLAVPFHADRRVDASDRPSGRNTLAGWQRPRMANASGDGRVAQTSRGDGDPAATAKRLRGNFAAMCIRCQRCASCANGRCAMRCTMHDTAMTLTLATMMHDRLTIRIAS